MTGGELLKSEVRVADDSPSPEINTKGRVQVIIMHVTPGR